MNTAKRYSAVSMIYLYASHNAFFSRNAQRMLMTIVIEYEPSFLPCH